MKFLDRFKKSQQPATITSEITRIERRYEAIRIAAAMAISMVLILLVVAAVSDNPFAAIQTFLLGPLQSTRRIGNVIELTTPLIFTGLAVTLIFKSNRFNLASDGAFYLATMVATIVALFSPFPPLITIVLAMLAGMVVGMIIGAIPALINYKFGANELVVSLMVNYVVGFLTLYLLNFWVRDRESTAIESYRLPPGVNLPRIVDGTRIHIGLIIALALTVVVYLVIYRTKWGYALRMTGLNEKFAKYSGIKVVGIVILAQAIGTGLAGLGGAVEMLGLYRSFIFLQSPRYGWDGLIVSVLSRGNPLAVPFAALFLAYIRVGADILNRASSIPPEIVAIVQAVIILLIAANAFLKQSKQKKIIQKTQELSEKGAN
jgi:ABC-type uncharacterized transport system permease subunit